MILTPTLCTYEWAFEISLGISETTIKSWSITELDVLLPVTTLKITQPKLPTSKTFF